MRRVRDLKQLPLQLLKIALLQPDPHLDNMLLGRSGQLLPMEGYGMEVLDGILATPVRSCESAANHTKEG